MSERKVSRRARAALELAFWDFERASLLAEHPVADEPVRKAAEPLPDPERAGVEERLRAFAALARANDAGARAQYERAHGLAGVRAHRSSGGARVWRIITESFPGHVNYVYLLHLESSEGAHTVLWDCGSGMGRARQMLVEGLSVAQRFLGAPSIDDINVILLSHGHYDHFGDVAWWKERTKAPLWIHEMDARVLEHYPERVVLTGRDMGIFLRAGGVDDGEARRLVKMYLAGKDRYGNVVVERRLEHQNKLFGGRARVIHTPGHCPGHVCLRIDDLLLVGDQVLSPISPHLSPQVLHPQNGLERYLFGLARLGHEEGVRTVLPAHYDPIPDLVGRIREIAEEHVQKLELTMGVCMQGATVKDVAHALFPHTEGYNVLLALLEAGTHVEYLHQLGSLVVKNVDALAHDPAQAAVYTSTAVSPRAPDLTALPSPAT